MRSLDHLMRPPQAACRVCGTPYPPDAVVGKRHCAPCRERGKTVQRATRAAARAGHQFRREFAADKGKYAPPTHEPKAAAPRGIYAFATEMPGTPTYSVALPQNTAALGTGSRCVMPEPNTDPPPRLLMAGPWQPPRYDREGRQIP